MTKNIKAGKSSKTGTDVQTLTNRGIPVHKGWGVLMLFVAVSIGYADYVVYMGTQGLVPKIMLVPSILFVAAFLVYKAQK